MGVLLFDNTDDVVRFTTLAGPLASVGDGAWTVAVLAKMNTTGDWNAVAYLLSGGGATQAGFSYNASVTRLYVDVGSGSTFGTFVPNATDTFIFAVSKATGTVAPRLGVKNLTTGSAWAHEAGSLGIANAAASSSLEIGVWQGTSDPFGGWVGLCGWWEGDMSDGQKETLSTNKQTSDWWNHSFAVPKFLSQLNVSTPSDLAGNATGLDISNLPTLDAGETLENWNFDGTGPVVGPAINPDYSRFPRHHLRRSR